MTRKSTKGEMSTRKLIIVESPAKIKTISKFLGSDFKIMSTFGHVKDLPERKLGVITDLENKTIELEYTALKDKNTTIADICKEAAKCGEIFLASDPDREGEIISWHIGQEIAKVVKDKNRIHRITFNEITKNAIINAINNKREVDEDKVHAQQARRVLDRWVGYEVSPILWRKITKGLSAGRVQSVALLLICTREDEILAFKPEESWSIHGTFGLGKEAIQAELFKIGGKTFKLKDKAAADKVLADLQKLAFVIGEITEKERGKNPLPPFMTSTLQQDAFNKLGFSVDKTMMTAQKLYEGIPLKDANTPEALITYMRTDSVRISETALDATREFIKKTYGDPYLPKDAQVYEKKGGQDAHEAIRPVDVTILPSLVAQYATPEQAKLYDLIWKRFVACQMSAARYFLRTVLINGENYTFKAVGSTLMFDGFLKVYLVEDEDEEQNVKIPAGIAQGNPLTLKKSEGRQHFTQPPARYTEATLVKELEKKGIGRPSTYSAILSTIQKRGYVKKDKKRFSPSELGRAVSSMLAKNLPDIINVSFTAKMEEDLDKIANHEIKRDTVLLNFYEKFQKDLVKFKEADGGQKAAVATEEKCPKCGKQLMIRFSKNGEFLGCKGFPECSFTTNFMRNEDGSIKLMSLAPVGEDAPKCPKCGKPMVQKMGKFGPFVACSGYPDCKHILQEKLSFPCPQCGKDIVKRKWRGGSFWGCSGYPDCKFAVFGKVIDEACPQCKNPYLIEVKDKKTGLKIQCGKSCGYSRAAAEEEA